MSEPQVPFPALHVGGSSYEAPPDGTESAQTPRDIDSSTSIPESTVSAAEKPTAGPARASAPGPRQRRVLKLLDQISRGQNEFIELIRGRYSPTGWLASLCVHGLALLALGLLLVTPEQKEPPRIITAGTDLDGPAAVGDLISEIEMEDSAAISVESAAALLASGGSTGDLQQGLTAAFGPPAGRGNGLGGGEGDAAGDAIAGRVQAAGGKGGNLQVSIGWGDRNDLDLHLVTPDGGRIFYARPLTPDGGELDVDMNVSGESAQPVENITWGGSTPPDGRYVVQVHFFKRNVGGPSRSQFNVRVQVGGDVRVLSGTANPGQFTQVARFEVRDGLAISLTTEMTETDDTELQLSAFDSKRAENRERAANEMLTDARDTSDPRLKAGKLRRLIRTFSGTEAAGAAQQMLDALPQ